MLGIALLASVELGCALALGRYDEVVADARRCEAEEPCAVAGGVQGCRCPVPIRAAARPSVDAAARTASCPQVERLYCPPLEHPRCEQNVCVADPVPE